MNTIKPLILALNFLTMSTAYGANQPQRVNLTHIIEYPDGTPMLLSPIEADSYCKGFFSGKSRLPTIKELALNENEPGVRNYSQELTDPVNNSVNQGVGIKAMYDLEVAENADDGFSEISADDGFFYNQERYDSSATPNYRTAQYGALTDLKLVSSSPSIGKDGYYAFSLKTGEILPDGTSLGIFRCVTPDDLSI